MVNAMAKKNTDNYDDLVQMASRDAEALGRLYEKYYEPIFRFCVHRVYCRATAEDVTASIFLVIAGKIRDFRGETESDFRSWLYAIAANQANSHIRKTLRQQKLLYDDASIIEAKNGSSNGSIRDDWPQVHAAIMQLKPIQQTIITLRFFENLTHEQIAEIVDKKPSAVRVVLHRSLKALKKHLKTVSLRKSIS